MNELTEEQKLLMEMVRNLAVREIAPRAIEIDENHSFPVHARDLFADLGLLSPLVPVEYGGTGMDITTFSMVLEEIGKVCASTALMLLAQADGMLSIILDGSPALKEKYLPRFGEKSTLMTAFAATEPGAGSDLLAMKTRAVKKGDKYVINGQKCFITNGSVADILTVWAYTDPSKGAKGMSTFVVERGTPGLIYGHNEKKMGMRGCPNSELFFEDLEVPAENLVGEEGKGFAYLMGALSINRVFCASQAVGIAQGALERAMQHTREREQFGKPIAHLTPIQFMIADMATEVEAARLLVRKATALLDAKDKQGPLIGGMAKTFASDTAMKVTTDAVQVMGGSGYMQEYQVERMMREAKLTQIYTGTNQITRMVTGRSLLFPS